MVKYIGYLLIIGFLASPKGHKTDAYSLFFSFRLAKIRYFCVLLQARKEKR